MCVDVAVDLSCDWSRPNIPSLRVDVGVGSNNRVGDFELPIKMVYIVGEFVR